MSIITTLTDKPWEQGGKLAETSTTQDQEKVRRSGLRVLLVVIGVLFFLFFVAFLMRSQYPDWQPLAELPSHPLYDKTVLWLNSAYLILASVFMQWSRRSAKKDQHKAASIGLLLGGLFSVAFVTGQIMFWQSLYQQGFAVDVNPAISFFYLFTGLHAAHVGVGILAWFAATVATLKHSRRYREYINLCAIYWHFLLGLWVLLFALLVSKPETYKAIAEFCGLG